MDARRDLGQTPSLASARAFRKYRVFSRHFTLSTIWLPLLQTASLYSKSWELSHEDIQQNL